MNKIVFEDGVVEEVSDRVWNALHDIKIKGLFQGVKVQCNTVASKEDSEECEKLEDEAFLKKIDNILNEKDLEDLIFGLQSENECLKDEMELLREDFSEECAELQTQLDELKNEFKSKFGDDYK